MWGYDNNHCPTECSFGIASYFVDREYCPWLPSPAACRAGTRPARYERNMCMQ